jgi:hypothetical protein
MKYEEEVFRYDTFKTAVLLKKKPVEKEKNERKKKKTE